VGRTVTNKLSVWLQPVADAIVIAYFTTTLSVVVFFNTSLITEDPPLPAAFEIPGTAALVQLNDGAYLLATELKAV